MIICPICLKEIPFVTRRLSTITSDCNDHNGDIGHSFAVYNNDQDDFVLTILLGKDYYIEVQSEDNKSKLFYWNANRLDGIDDLIFDISYTKCCNALDAINKFLKLRSFF